MDIVKYIKSQVPISEETERDLAKTIRRKFFKKKELILPVENTSKQIYFVEQGLARVFYSKKDKNVTLYFLQENKIGVPIDSIFYNQVCKFGIEAVSDTSVVLVQFMQWEKLVDSDVQLKKYTDRLMVEYVKKATDRIYNLKFQTPEERYDNMLIEFPIIFLQAPLGHIASYLGITQETLSKLRAKK